MIALEEIRSFGLKDIYFLIIIALIISLFQYLAVYLFNPSIAFIISLSVIAIGINCVILILRRSGVAGIFLVLNSLITLFLNDIGLIGFSKVIVFLLVGAIFELIYLFLKGHIHNIPLDLFFGTSISMANIPIFVAYILSPNLAASFPIALLNLMVIAFVTGLAASLIVFVVWGLFEGTKAGIKIISYFGLLNSSWR